MSEHAPLPPEPASTPAGKTVGLLMWLFVMVATALVLMGIWGVGTAESMLKVAATAGLATLVGSFLAMALRR